MGRHAQGWRLVSGRRPQDPLYIRFRHAGKRYYLSTGERDSGRATQRAETIYAAVVSGRWGQATRLSPAAPIDELVSEYLAHIEATGSHERFSMQRTHFRAHLLRFFSSLCEIGSEAAWADFEAHRRRCAVSSRTIAKELSTLRMFAKWCRLRIPADLITRSASIRSPIPLIRSPGRSASDGLGGWSGSGLSLWGLGFHALLAAHGGSTQPEDVSVVDESVANGVGDCGVA
jgi:hypothetical protein